MSLHRLFFCGPSRPAGRPNSAYRVRINRTAVAATAGAGRTRTHECLSLFYYFVLIVELRGYGRAQLNGLETATSTGSRIDRQAAGLLRDRTFDPRISAPWVVARVRDGG